MREPQAELWAAVRLMAEGSDWQRDQGETLTEWAQRNIKASQTVKSRSSATPERLADIARKWCPDAPLRCVSAIEEALSLPSAITPTSEDAEKLVEEYDAALLDVYDDQSTRAAAREAEKRYEPVRQKLIAALSAKSATASPEVPLCGGCAQAWFTERNHLKGDHGCVVCAFLGNTADRTVKP